MSRIQKGTAAKEKRIRAAARTGRSRHGRAEQYNKAFDRAYNAGFNAGFARGLADGQQ